MANEYVENGVPFLRSQDVLPFRIDTSGVKQISPTFHRRITKSRLQPGDVVIVRTGYPGTASVIPRAIVEANCADLVIVRPSVDLDAHFAACLFNSQAGKAAVSGRLVGAAQQHFNVGAAKTMEIALPPIDEQRRIASILSAYDDLIEVNRRRVAILEEMARRLFEEWFVGLRFPGHDIVPVHNTVDGPLPESWSYAPLGDICSTMRSGFTPPRKDASFWKDGTVDWYTTGELRDCFLGIPVEKITQLAARENPARIFQRGTLFLALYGASIGRLGIATGSCSCNQAALAIKPNTDMVGPWFLWETLVRLKKHFISIAQGAAQQNISKEKVAATRVLVPGQDIALRYEALVSPMWDHRQRLEAQGKVLAAARDLLLPRLVSGELSVADAPMPAHLREAAD